MKNSLLLEFPLCEFEQRIKKLVDGMNNMGLDAVILTNDENTYYFTGYRSISWHSKVSTPGVLVITKDGDIAVNTSKGAIATAKITSCAEDFRFFGPNNYGSYAKAIASLLVEKGLEKGKIGFELGRGQKMHLNYLNEKDLFNEIKDITPVDISKLLWDIRKIKSTLEIDVIKKCCDINVKGFKKGIEQLKENMTEIKLYQNILQEYFILGAEHTLQLSVRAGKERSIQKYSPAFDREIKNGEIVTIEGGPEYKRYFSDAIRHVVVGKVDKEKQQLFDLAREALYKGMEVIKAGALMKDVAKAINSFLAESKIEHTNINYNCCGYSIGVGAYELPEIVENTDEVIEKGMVLVLNPCIQNQRVGRIEMKENILVTDSGYEMLTYTSNELIQI